MRTTACAHGAVVDVEIPGTYIVDILQDNTCQVKDTVVVEFNDCVGECRVIAPTAFSPNGDGVNDIFLVKEDCPFGYDIFILEVYDRWGNLIFQSDDPSRGWSGMHRGDIAPIGVYTWYVRYIKSKDEKSNSNLVRGNVTLIQ